MTKAKENSPNVEVNQEASQETLLPEENANQESNLVVMIDSGPVSLERYFGSKLILAAPMTEKTFKGEVKGQFVDHDIEDMSGYFVQYEDGYKSWSPKKQFEKAYHRMEYLNFGQAIEAMKAGLKVARKGWNGKGIHLELQRPDENSKMTSPYIFIDTTGLVTDNAHAPKSRVPWLASQTDMLAEDWIIVTW